jgi:hypothetical protein
MRVQLKISVTVVDEEPTPLGPPNDFVGHGRCKYIYGDVKKKAWMCCGHPVNANQAKPWCDYHRRKVFDASK